MKYQSVTAPMGMRTRCRSTVLFIVYSDSYIYTELVEVIHFQYLFGLQNVSNSASFSDMNGGSHHVYRRNNP